MRVVVSAAALLSIALSSCSVTVTHSTASGRIQIASGRVNGHSWGFAAYHFPYGGTAISYEGLFAGGGARFAGFSVPEDVDASALHATASSGRVSEEVDAVVGFAPKDAAVVTLKTPDGTMLRTPALAITGFPVRFFVFVGPTLLGSGPSRLAAYTASGKRVTARRA